MSHSEPMAVLEVHSLGAALVILDRVTKASPVRLIHAELNDYYGFAMKFAGDSAALMAAIDEADTIATRMQASCKHFLLNSPASEIDRVLLGPNEFQPLLNQEVVYIPKEPIMRSSPPAIGLIETQGFTAVIKAIDAALKAADVTIIGKEKLGGGYITVLLAGDIAAVEAAVAVATKQVEGLGKLIAAHVITAPSDDHMGLIIAASGVSASQKP